MKFNWGIALLFSLFLSRQNLIARETFLASYLDSELSPNQIALGGTQVANGGLLGAAFNNPALLKFVIRPEIYFSHKKSFLEDSNNALALSLPLKRETFSIGIKHFRSPQIQRTQLDANGLPLIDPASFRPSAYIGHLAGAKSLGAFDVGLNAKIWSENIDRRSYSGAVLDAGTFIRKKLFGTNLALSVKNIPLQRESYSLPVKWNTGLVKHLRWVSILGNIERGKASESFNMGIESKSLDPFCLRAGYRLPFTSDIAQFNRLSFGFGIRIRTWRLDYSWSSKNELGEDHTIAITVGLGMTPEEKKQAEERQEMEFTNRLKDKAKHHLLESRNYLKKDDWEKALEELRLALTWDPENDEVKKSFASVLFKKNELETIKVFNLGTTAAQNQDWIDASTFFQEASRREPQNEIYQQKSKWARSKVSELMSGQKNENNAYRKGIQNYINGEFESALKIWDALDMTENKYPELREYMAKARANILEKKLVSATQKEDPVFVFDENIQQLNAKAFQEYSQGNLELAVVLWKRAFKLDPKNDRLKKNIERVESELELKEGRDE